MSEPLEVRLENIEKSQLRIQRFMKEIEDILETLITNDTEILEAIGQILLVVPQMQARNEQNQARLMEEIRRELAQFKAEIAASTVSAPKTTQADPDTFAAINPEIVLLQHLYSFLSHPVALDIGANVGDVTARLLETGYEVYAFEPNPPTFAALQEKFAEESRAHLFQMGLGSTPGTLDLHVAVDPKGQQKYGDPSLFSSFVDHPMPRDLPFTGKVPVAVETLESLRKAGRIPARVGVVKIDTEGFDLEVMRGMGALETDVVMSEFWDPAHSFGKSGNGRLDESVKEMKSRGFHWYVVIYHHDESKTLAYYCNRPSTVSDSWGNAIFFRDHELFLRAMKWCEGSLTAKS
jgi:FkbM family methyltransferase